MSTTVLPSQASLQQEVACVNDDTEDVQCDSLRVDNNRTGLSDLHQCLIDIDEEVGEEELEGFKFLCRDHISVSKLDRAQTCLEIFDIMQKMVLIDVNNVDFLLECLGRVHRFDLVRKLGFQPDAVRDHLPNFKKLYPFRTLLMDITEDLDDQETEKIRFFLRGKIRKKLLNEKRSLLQLFVFMEQEGLLAPSNLQLLTKTMESVRRGDLVDKIREYQGLPPLKRHEPGLPRNLNPTVPSQHQVNVGPNEHVNRAFSQEPHQQREGLVQSGSAGNLPGQDQSSQIERSISAGTLSVPSGELEVSSRATLPEHLILQIAEDLKEQVNDMGIELLFSNAQLAQYEREIPDTKQRTVRILQDWQTNLDDKGRITPTLLYVLNKLGLKNASQAVKRWIDSINTDQAIPQQNMAGFEPSGPPGDSENVCVSMRHAQNVAEQIPPQQHLENVQVVENLQQLHISPNQLAENRCLYVNGEAVYRVGEQIVINPGVSRQLQPMVIPGQGEGQILPGQQGQGTAVGNPARVSGPVLQGQGRQSEGLTAPPPLKQYRMNRDPRGWCVIINNEKFHVDRGDRESKEMPPRNGTERDAASLEHMFNKLGFIVQRHNNLSNTQMMNVLIDAAHNVDHTCFDCFVCCILTHGVLGHLYGSNGVLISIQDLTSTFQANRCPTLAGKPKLFFLQACQGRDKMEGGAIQQDGPTPIPDKNNDISTDQGDSKEMIPNEADFLLGYATVPGYVSFRSRNHGSWYIRKLCELLEKYSNSYDLMSILVEVNREVANANASMDGGLYKQIPAPLVTLRKQLFFGKLSQPPRV
ncbi:caspase-8-like [Mercenaria mercenaria]|uniref:caspase-8-like n=1 Tax=Mercenaria mercenaria TaxID=6596 RepID=UPI00234F8F65|nr:caspase-8-like [Mercenaria mercenaria]XP_053385491.1 caspase-8-like [Mercenaria mercenaria]XP_053385492.1 caspase-8-like [Mercenaria mercenaria]XP_053385493.1 caspase-8-like [Mercenaria mercenaria]